MYKTIKYNANVRLTFEQFCKLVDEKIAIDKRRVELIQKYNNDTITAEEEKEEQRLAHIEDEINAVIYNNHYYYKMKKIGELGRMVDAKWGLDGKLEVEKKEEVTA